MDRRWIWAGSGLPLLGFEAIGSKDGQATKVAVNTQTSRLRAADDDED
ncbi:hypothetical protein MTR72_31075 [Bradyrhizobium sp. ISRA442]